MIKPFRSSKKVFGCFFIVAVFITVFLPGVHAAKIGLFLGTFDPPHPGIAQMIAEAQNQLGLEMVYVLPTPSPVDRPEVAPVSHRLAMIRLMAQAIPGLVTLSEADLLLLSSRQPENVFAAMREDIMSRRSSEDEIYQIVGEDALPKLIAKKQLPEKSESRKLVVFPRHGILKLKHPAIDLLEKEGKLIRLATEIPDLASRELRKKFKSGQMPSHDELSKDIVNYILREGLYGVKRAELTRDEIDLLKIEGYSAKPVLLHSPTTDTIFVPAHLESYLSASELSGDHDQTAFPISILDLLRRFQIQVTIFQAPTTDSLDWLETQGWKTFFAFVPDQNLELPMYFFARRGEEWHLFITGLYAEQPCYDLVAKIYNFCAVNSISTDCLNILLPVSK